ncbi:MAG: hypothetical protein P9M14_17625 [Candidatus Alcyoniella australis]|nr:hypothetical protein [Candidatus Alcyoniella australis]
MGRRSAVVYQSSEGLGSMRIVLLLLIVLTLMATIMFLATLGDRPFGQSTPDQTAAPGDHSTVAVIGTAAWISTPWLAVVPAG